MLKLNQTLVTTKTIELRNVPADLHKAIRQAALTDDISMNQWIIRALEQRINELTAGGK